MRKVITLLLLQLSAFALFGANINENTPHYPSDANIVGHVVDAQTGEHVPGITIQIKGTTFGTVTDATGHYFLRNLKPGNITIVVRGIGYGSQERTLKVEKGKMSEENFEVTKDNISLDQVVVSANREQTLRRLAPTLVNVVSDKLFTRANAVNLAQGLVFQPGVRVENDCQNCGFNQVRINGLDGRYTQILIDSRPVMSALAGVYGLEQIPANMVERVEVVRGGGSALFGASAIAGVVNVITKEPTHNSASFNECLSFTGMKTLDNVMSFNASVVSDDNRAGAMVFGQARYRKPWDADGDGFSELGKIDTRSVGAHAFYRLSQLSKLTAEVHTIQEFRRGGDHLDLPAHAAAVTEQIQHSIYSGSARYDLYSKDYKHHFQAYTSAQIINRNSYYGGIGDLADEDGPYGVVGRPIPDSIYGKNYGVTRGRTYNGGLQYTYNFEKLLFMPAQILVGAEITRDMLRDEMPLRRWEPVLGEDGNPVLVNGKPVTRFPTLDQRINDWSQLAQVEWKNDMFSFLIGARLNENSTLDKPVFSPRATLRYNPRKNINLRATYAKGFRAPQTFDEDLHVGVVGGEAQRVVNKSDLKSEASHAIGISADLYHNFGDVRTNLMIEGFYNRLVDVFVLNEMASQGDGIKRFERINGSGAKVYGANIEAKVAYRWLQIQAGITLTSAMYDDAQEWGEQTERGAGENFKKDDEGLWQNEPQSDRHIMRTPDVYGYFTMGFNPCKPLNISVTGTYTGRMYVPHAIEYGVHAAVGENFKPVAPDADDHAPRIDELKKSPAFFDLGMKINYEFKLGSTGRLELYTGMKNLFNSFQSDFDRGANRDSAYIYGPTQPRTIYFGTRFLF